MSNNRVKVEYLNTNKPNNYLKCELYYSLGGINYFNYKNEPRGYYVSVTPVERTTLDGGGVMEGFAAFSGIKSLVHECQRKGKGAAEKAMALYEQTKQEIINARFTALLEGSPAA